MKTATPIAIGVLLAGGLLGSAAAAEPTALLTEFMDNPLAIDQLSPRFSWAIGDAGRGSRQTAFQLLVASDKDKETITLKGLTGQVAVTARY